MTKNHELKKQGETLLPGLLKPSDAAIASKDHRALEIPAPRGGDFFVAAIGQSW